VLATETEIASWRARIEWLQSARDLLERSRMHQGVHPTRSDDRPAAQAGNGARALTYACTSSGVSCPEVGRGLYQWRAGVFTCLRMNIQKRLVTTGQPGRCRRTMTNESAGQGLGGGACSAREWPLTRPPSALPSAGRGAETGEQERIRIELSKSQVDQVIRAAGQGGTMSVLLSALKDPRWKLSLDSDEWGYPAQMDDRRLSASLLSGLLVLSCFST